MKRVLVFLVFVTTLLSLPSAAKRLTYGFKVAKMNLEFPFHPEWEISPQPEMVPILSQPFHFLGKGAQSFVFESKDGQYVIKLFRYDQPSSEAKIIDLFNACKMAYDQLREETGLLYIHLNPTPIGLPTLQCTDAIGRKYHFPLDQMRFALQKKASPFRSSIEMSPQKRIDEFVSLLQARTQKKILNTDPNLSRNFGFLPDRAIEFDFGSYRYSPEMDQKAEIEKYTQRLRRWLCKHHPEWVAYLDQNL